jgi:hypothetical protein
MPHCHILQDLKVHIPVLFYEPVFSGFPYTCEKHCKTTVTHPFAMVTTDFITDLPENNGCDSIMVMVDHDLTKGAIFIPCSKMIMALGAADLYLQHVYTWFGLPDKIISDRDPRFASRLFQELGKLLVIKLAMSTAYHPQTDGEIKHVNQELKVYLRVFCSNNPETWKGFLPTAEFAHNQKFHSAVKNTTFFLIMGSHPRAIPLAYAKTDVPAVEQRIAQLQKAHNKALASHELARQMMANRINKKFQPFKEGDKVWLDSKNLKIGYPTRKLAPKREGPFSITKVISTHAYQLHGEFTPSSTPHFLRHSKKLKHMEPIT